MLKHFFNIAIKCIKHERLSSIVKITGLSLGFAIFFLIMTYIHYEKSFDNYFSNSPEVYRLGFTNTSENGEIWNGSFCPVPLAETIQKSFPEVKAACRLYQEDMAPTLVYDNIAYEDMNCYFVDSTFHSVINHNIIKGSKKGLLSKPNTVTISEHLAKKIFKDEDPIGKTIKYNNVVPLEITGVFEDEPRNASIKYDALISMSTPNFVYPKNNNNWDLWFAKTLVLLNPGTDYNQLSEKISTLVSQFKPQSSKNNIWSVYLEPIEKIHLYSKVETGRESSMTGKTISLLYLIAFFILSIALVNHLNLSISHALDRLKLSGIEKVSGQKPVQLFLKVIIENLVIFSVSLVFSIILLLIITPVLNHALETGISFHTFDITLLLVIMTVFIVSILLLSAVDFFIHSKVHLITALQGKISNKSSEKNWRQVFVSFQFIISIVLITSTLVFFSQTNFMMKKDIGMDTNKILVINGNTLFHLDNYKTRCTSFKDELMNNPNIHAVSGSNVIPAHHAFSDDVHCLSDPNRKLTNSSIIMTNSEFIDTYSIKLLAGHNFPANTNKNVRKAIINKACAEALGYENPEDAVGETIVRGFLNRNYEVCGVTDNFNLSNQIKNNIPFTIYFDNNTYRYISVKYSSLSYSEIKSQVEKTWHNIFPEEICRTFDLTDSYLKTYAQEKMQVNFLSICSLIAVIIACIGVFGLAFHSITLKTKEIGVRKVCGARVFDIIKIIIQNYLVIITISTTISVIPAYLLAKQWLESYYFKIQLNAFYFLAPMFLISFVTLLTISYHSVKAAMNNPVKALRYE